MVQMGDAASVERCIQSLNNLTFFGKKMQLGYSKQAFLNDVQQPFELPDGSPSFRDFMGNRNNRFTNPEAASKNRIAPPAKVLHFFNAPHNMTEEEILNIFRSQGAPLPSGVKLFQSKSMCCFGGIILLVNMFVLKRKEVHQDSSSLKAFLTLLNHWFSPITSPYPILVSVKLSLSLPYLN